MAQLRTHDPEQITALEGTPSVLVVLVVFDGAGWLRECLAGLAAQTHPRLGVLAVDCGSTDGSRDLLLKALGPERVVDLVRNRGFPAAVQAALKTDVAGKADYLLLLHDDTALAPEAVARLVEAAERIDGAGVVGPKVVDWDDLGVLREVGLSTDRFGYPYSPLEEDEIDQGQYDRVREVLFVSSCAMLVSRAAWSRTGPPDERLAARFEDLDFCWRARLAGFRVLVSPLAVARHRGATVRGERAANHPNRDRTRYFAERAALAAMLKNYSVLSLLWVLPLYAVQGVGKLAGFGLSRRFDDAWQVLQAWGWNLTRLPGTVRRRVRAQSVRAVRDGAVRRYMAPSTIRLRRWLDVANEVLLGRTRGYVGEEEEPTALPLSARAASLARDHPAGVAWGLAILIGLLSFRHLWGPEPLSGGAVPAFPEVAGDFFRELGSGIRTSGLGGAQGASPALAMLGAISWALSSTALALKALMMALPLLAGVTFYRAVYRRTGQRGAAALGAGCYALSGVALWAFSEGRLAVLVLLVVLPPLSERISLAFGARRVDRPVRFVFGTGIVLAVACAFYPGAALSFALLAVVHLVFGAPRGRRLRGAALTVAGAVVAVGLLIPLALDLVNAPGLGLASASGEADFGLLARLAPGDSPGSWPVAWFLPVAAFLAFSVVEGSGFRPALRHLVIGVAALFLAWGSAAGRLPDAATNVPAYLASLAVSYCFLVSLGLASILPTMGRRSFGYRQLTAVAMVIALAGGLVLHGVQAARADWDIGPDRLPPAWPLVSEEDLGNTYRVLWLGGSSGEELPPPAGDPAGAALSGPGQPAVRFAVGDRDGASALDVGRTFWGEGYDHLEQAIRILLSGSTRHGGSLLAPMAVLYVVAEAGDLPPTVVERLDQQLDLDLIPAEGLILYRNSAALPRRALVTSPDFAGAASDSDPLALARMSRPEATPLGPADGPVSGDPGDAAAYVFVADQFASGWRLEGGADDRPADRAFGWANGFPVPEGTPFTIGFADQRTRTLQVAGLGALWLIALWITRKPARRGVSSVRSGVSGVRGVDEVREGAIR
jgi:GT2 family glycosyltransferase